MGTAGGLLSAPARMNTPAPWDALAPSLPGFLPGRHLQPGAAPRGDAGGGRDPRHARALPHHAQVAHLLLQRGHGRWVLCEKKCWQATHQAAWCTAPAPKLRPDPHLPVAPPACHASLLPHQGNVCQGGWVQGARLLSTAQPAVARPVARAERCAGGRECQALLCLRSCCGPCPPTPHLTHPTNKNRCLPPD